MHAKQILGQSLLIGREAVSVPKGYLAVYVGQRQKKRYVVPVSFLNQPLFRDLLRKAEEEFGFDHPMGGLTIPCTEDTFIALTSWLSQS
ncbi:auxin-responsive protein SAUR21-like [Rhodamnia argentea]|uniref:Auxin-responsive protein SAUR21-like n=1 Tax=Rhodamnia argentea TaxID=178133 RepID=A0A8B8NLQ6_9MYRT|nr:auxin-responsive protein SAUR21-like [Rhodamnia argentea]